MIEDRQTDFENITNTDNLYKAYKKSKQGKGFSKSSQKFQVVALDGIYQIKRSLETKKYEISRYNEFVIYEPKERTKVFVDWKMKRGIFKDDQTN